MEAQTLPFAAEVVARLHGVDRPRSLKMLSAQASWLSTSSEVPGYSPHEVGLLHHVKWHNSLVLRFPSMHSPHHTKLTGLTRKQRITSIPWSIQQSLCISHRARERSG